MRRTLQKAAAIFIVLFGVAQLFRPNRTNPATDASRSIHAHVAASLAAVLDRSCGDCHSNDTKWPWYTQVAPFSWLMAHGVSEGRKAVNFSEWGVYSPEERHTLLTASCQDVTDGKMPGPYTLIRPETRLSAHDIEIICTAAQLLHK